MNLTFHKSHLDTLTKLNELAKKHNARINFGTNNTHSGTDDYREDIYDFFPDKFWKLLQNDELIDDVFDTFLYDDKSDVWFELAQTIDNKSVYSVMTYHENRLHCILRSDWDILLEIRIDSTDDIKDKETLKELKEFIKETIYGYGDFIEINDSYTLIRGFGNKGVSKDHRVYKPDMALHYFMELVCDYLGEPHINNTY